MNRTLSKRIAIVGAAESDLGKVPGLSALELQGQATQRALKAQGYGCRISTGYEILTTDFRRMLADTGHTATYVDSTSVGCRHVCISASLVDRLGMC